MMGWYVLGAAPAVVLLVCVAYAIWDETGWVGVLAVFGGTALVMAGLMWFATGVAT